MKAAMLYGKFLKLTLLNNIRSYFIVILDTHARKEPMATEQRPICLVTEGLEEDTMT